MAFEYELTANASALRITGTDLQTRTLAIPAEIDGLPVREIGNSAFARTDAEELVLPDGLKKIGRMSFFNSQKLKRLTVHDSVDDCGDGFFRECKALTGITLYLHNNDTTILKDLLTDLTEEVRVHLIPDQSADFWLTFPPYNQYYVEDTFARANHPKLEGSGYPYRECVLRREIRFAEYDRLFTKAVIDSPRAAVMIALNRLISPRELRPEAEERYSSYLAEHMETLLLRLVEEEDTPHLNALLHLGEERLSALTGNVLETALQLASERKLPEISAMLMEFRSRHGQSTGPEVFDLDDLFGF